MALTEITAKAHLSKDERCTAHWLNENNDERQDIEITNAQYKAWNFDQAAHRAILGPGKWKLLGGASYLTTDRGFGEDAFLDGEYVEHMGKLIGKHENGDIFDVSADEYEVKDGTLQEKAGG